MDGGKAADEAEKVTAPHQGGQGDDHLTEDLADRAIEFLGDLRAADAGKPFFLVFATGARHSPHQPPPRWREHYRGRFDLGWDAWREQAFARQLAAGLFPAPPSCPERPSWVPATE